MYSINVSLFFELNGVPSGRVISSLLMPSEPLEKGMGLVLFVPHSHYRQYIYVSQLEVLLGRGTASQGTPFRLSCLHYKQMLVAEKQPQLTSTRLQ